MAMLASSAEMGGHWYETHLLLVLGSYVLHHVAQVGHICLHSTVLHVAISLCVVYGIGRVYTLLYALHHH